MRVAFVVQRYGQEVIGGAETHARLVAEQLVKTHGWQIDVFSTTALNYQSWRPYYQTGKETLNGVCVYRYSCRFRRLPFLFRFFNRAVAPLIYFFAKRPTLPLAFLWRPFALAIEYLWFILQGPYCPDLLTALKKKESNYRKIFFFTYLYYPTAIGLPSFKEKAVMIPTAHDELPLYFPKCQHALSAAPIHLVNTEEEKKLIETLIQNPHTRFLQAGVGVDPKLLISKEVPPGAELQTFIPPQPYLLYLGRICKGKGVDQLLKHYLDFIASRPAIIPYLLLAGAKEKDICIPSHPYIQYLGSVSEETKTNLLRQAKALINPSSHESLSLIVLEALALKTPIIVNGHCKVLRSYAQATPTVLSYLNHEEFHSHLLRVLSPADGQIWEQKLINSQSWVKQKYSWTKVLEAYQHAVNI